MIIENIRFLDKNYKLVKGKIEYNNGYFTEITGTETRDAKTDIIIPGMVDIHTHGCGGVDPMECDEKEFEKMAMCYAQNGTTTFLATTLTDNFNKIKNMVKKVSKVMEKNLFGARVSGVHMEGPHFAGDEYIGANNARYVRKLNIPEMKELINLYPNVIKIEDVDPTLEGAEEYIRTFKQFYNISLGHTSADFECAKKAFLFGAKNITHSFNGMKPLHHRHPNMIGAAFNSNVFMEIICDGFHIHPEIIKIAYKLAGAERLSFISDSLCSMGAEEGEYVIGGLKTIVKNNEARLEDGTICGGMTPLYRQVLNAVSYGIPFNMAVKCATLTPARAAGIDDVCGSIEEGKLADFLVLNKDYELKSVYVGGREI